MENVTEKPLTTKKGTFPASVATIIDSCRVAINRGETHGIRLGQRMLIYRMSEEEIKDPNTGESLGYLEIVRGTGKVTHVQEKLSIIESDNTISRKKLAKDWMERVVKGLPAEEEVFELAPFYNPEMGDLVKPI